VRVNKFKERPLTIERRMVLQLLRQWREAGGGERFPRLDEIDCDALAILGITVTC